MYTKILLKLGGSVITNKSVEIELRPTELENLCKQINVILDENPTLEIYLGHGAGSFGHIKASQFLSEVHKLTESKIDDYLIEIHNQVTELNEIVLEYLNKFVSAENLLRIKEIVHGDVNFAGKPYIYSTEDQFRILCQESKLKPDLTILVTDQDGIYYDFREQSKGIIELINVDNFEEIKFSVNEQDATGAMEGKLKKSFKILNYCPKVVILNGLHPERIASYLKGEKVICTEITK
jgi:isopentenyl phosphate kinase